MPDLVRTARPLCSLQRLAVVACALISAGCASWLGTEPRIQNRLVDHYNRIAEQVAKTDPEIQSDLPSPSLGEGRDLVPPDPADRWPIALYDALRIGIENNKIIRQNAQFMSPGNPVLRNPDGVPSVFDSIIQNEGVLYGQRGTQAALSDFDPRLTTIFKSGNDQTVQNSLVQAPPNQILENNYTSYQSRLEQTFLNGASVAINNNWNYQLTNQPLQLFNSAYTGVLGAEFRQPLWSGGGQFFTSVAGPANQRARGFSNVSQGIVIARINQRLSEIDLHENLQNLARDIGESYWDLYQTYQDYESERGSAKVAKDLWDSMRRREYQESGVDLAQAEDAYFDAKGREELALSNLYLTEAKFRRLLGLPIDDKRVIFPSDVPREEEISLDRPRCLYEALCNRLELTRQKTNLHSLELQLVAARKLVAPKLDFVSGYALNGFGHNFLNANTENFNSAVSNLYTGRETSWSAGFEYSIPLWLRQEKAQVRQLEFRIVKARRALATQEDEIAHELNNVLLTIKRSQSISKIYQLRLMAAKRRVNAARKAYEGGYKNSDLFLRALASQTLAQVAYAKSITEYNKSLRELLYRTGRLLPMDGISILDVDGLPINAPMQEEVPPEPVPELPSPSGPENKPDTKPKRKTPVADGVRPEVPAGYSTISSIPDSVTEDTSDDVPPSPTDWTTDSSAEAPQELPFDPSMRDDTTTSGDNEPGFSLVIPPSPEE